MSNATAEATQTQIAPPPTLAFETVERVSCMKCQSPIPQENVHRRFLHSGVQEITCKCDHCDQICRATRQNRNGFWQLLEVKIVTAPAEIDGFNRKLAYLKGDTQIAASESKRPKRASA